MTNAIRGAGRRLREAVAAGAYQEAQSRLAEYSRAVSRAALEPPSGEGRALEALREARELMIWAERTVRADRAHTQHLLEGMAAGRLYRLSASQREPRFGLEG